MVVYCSAATCELSHEVAERLRKNGISPVFVLERGLGSMEDQKMIDRLRAPAWGRLYEARVASLMRIALGALFVFAGVTKAYDPGAFAIEIQRYNLIPWIPGALASVYLPWLEILAGALLICEKIRARSAACDHLFVVGFQLCSGQRDVPRSQHRLRLFWQGIHRHRHDFSVGAEYSAARVYRLSLVR